MKTKSGTLISAPTNAAVIEVSMRMMHFFDVSKNDEMFSGFCSRIQARLNRCCRRRCCANCQKQKIVALKGRIWVILFSGWYIVVSIHGRAVSSITYLRSPIKDAEPFSSLRI